jgi:hypothetical protein
MQKRQGKINCAANSAVTYSYKNDSLRSFITGTNRFKGIILAIIYCVRRQSQLLVEIATAKSTLYELFRDFLFFCSLSNRRNLL